MAFKTPAKLTVFFVVFSFLKLALAWAGLEEIASGQPQILGRNLGTESYVEVKAKKLANAKVIWSNIDYFHERKMEPPSDKEILESFAFGIPSEGEEASAFLQQEKVLMADRYGGDMLGLNMGSGRASSAGQFQIKGIGKTPLVSNSEKDGHANGLVPFHEYREAIFGEINQQLPYKGNRVIAIIDRGTFTIGRDGKRHRNILIIREDPIRPAHYVEAWHGTGPFRNSEQARITQASKYFINSLPIPKEFQNASDGIKIKEGLREYSIRVAKQYAAAYAARLYHGATSLSNIELQGKWLDYGTQTAQPGFGKIRILDHIEQAGSIEQIETSLIKKFILDIKANFPPNIVQHIPSEKELVLHFRTTYFQSLEKEFLKLTGAPIEIIEKITQSLDSSSLAKTLISIAQHGAIEVTARYQVPNKLNTFDLEEILNTLAQNLWRSENELKQKLTKVMPGQAYQKLRSQLAKAYYRFMKRVKSEALNDGINIESLTEYIVQSAKLKNKKTPDIYRWNMMDEDFKLIAQYEISNDPTPIREAIQRRIANSKKYFQQRSPYELVLKEEVNPSNGQLHRYLYDAKTSQYRQEITHLETDNHPPRNHDKKSNRPCPAFIRTILDIHSELSGLF